MIQPNTPLYTVKVHWFSRSDWRGTTQRVERVPLHSLLRITIASCYETSLVGIKIQRPTSPICKRVTVCGGAGWLMDPLLLFGKVKGKTENESESWRLSAEDILL